MEYVDFELEIGSGSGRDYPVTVRSPEGEAHAIMRFPFDELQLQKCLTDLENALLRSGGRNETRRKVLPPQEKAVQEFGQALFDAVLVGNVRDTYAASRRGASRPGKGLRLKLRIQAPELAALPWEFLYDPHQREYVCLSRKTPMVRYLEVPQPIQALTVTPPLRILVMVASPTDLDPLDTEREKQRVEGATKDIQARGLVHLTWLRGQTWRDLLKAMSAGPWHVFHFVGHGGFDRNQDEGLIALADEKGHSHHLRATLFARLLSDHDSLRLVLLNSCEGARGGSVDVFSSTAATLVQRGIPAVLAMQYEISDRAAIEFAQAFYEAVAQGMPIDTAVAEARRSVSVAIDGTVEWGTPVLYMRSPDGLLFNLADGSVTAPGTPGEREPSGGPRPAGIVSEQKPRRHEGQQHLESLYTEALERFYTEQWQQAVELFTAIVTQQPDYEDATSKLEEARRQFALAQQYADGSRAFEAGAWAEAIRHLEPLVARDAAYRDGATLLETARRQKKLAGLYAEARRLHEAAQWQAAVNVFDHIHVLDAGYPDAEGLLASARQHLLVVEEERTLASLYGQAVRHMNAGDVQQAMARLQELQERRPGYRETDALLARALRELSGLNSAPLNLLAILKVTEGLSQEAAKAAPTATMSRRRKRVKGPSTQGAPAIVPSTVDRVELLRTLEGHTGRVWSVAFTPDGVHLASASEDKTVRLWRVCDGELVSTLSGHTGAVWSVAIAPDGRTLASGSADTTVRLWQVSDGKPVRTLSGHGKQVNAVAFAPDGQILASGGGGDFFAGDTSIRLWRAANGELLRTLDGHTGKVNSLAFTPDGQMLASGHDSTFGGVKLIKLWRVADGELLRELEAAIGVTSVVFTPDGQTLVASSSGGPTLVAATLLRLWRVLDWAPLPSLHGHVSYFNSVALAPDGELLAVGGGTWGGAGSTIGLWRQAEGKLLGTLAGHTGQVRGVAFAADGTVLASGSDDQTVRLWGVK